MLKFFGLSLEILLIFFVLQIRSMELTENDQELADFLKKTNLLRIIENDEGVVKRSGVFFAPKRAKRSSESTNLIRDEISNEINDLEQKINLESLQTAAWILLLANNSQKKEKPVQYLTPRLGRENGANIVQNRPPFAPRLGKKSLPFSPRLGRQLFEFE